MPASLDNYIGASIQSARIPGLALGVVQGDQVIHLKGYGVAGPDGRPVTAQTPFILGSTSKSFTALAVMQLVEAGKIVLDAPVTTYLPWFRTADPEASAKISVRHLLYQTSGLRGYTEIRLGQDLSAAFAAVVDELHSQYALGFAPPKRDGKTHKVDVRVTGSGLKVRGRKSYVAPKQ